VSRRAGVRAVRGPDGLTWTVEVRAPGTTNAMVVFHHPDPLKRATRYAWWVTGGPEARDVTGRLDPASVLAALDDAALLRLFRRSMPVESQVPRFETG
jgi:hypothetical protein